MKILVQNIAKLLKRQALWRNHCTASGKLNKGSIRRRTKCTLIPGDGIGPELTAALQLVFKEGEIPVDFDLFPFSEKKPIPKIKFDEVKASIKKNGVCIKGTLDRSDQRLGGTSLTLKLIKDLDIFASVVHILSLPGVKSRHKNIDTVIIRESTEGEYSALEHESVCGVVECLKIITSQNSKRIAKFAFDYATKNQRKKVTAVHKANIMKLSDGLFLETCESVSKLYPRIKFEKMIVDNTTMQLVSHPNQFDVMVTPNLYGNIVQNLAAGLVGGAGVVPGSAFSSEVAIFEPGAHHTFEKAVGKNLANPTAMFLCGAELLRHVNLHQHSDRLIEAIKKVLVEEKVMTKDLGGSSTMDDYVQCIIAYLK